MIPTSSGRPSLQKRSSSGIGHATDTEGASEGRASTNADSLFRWDDLIEDTWTEPSNPEVAEPLPSHDLEAAIAKHEEYTRQLNDENVHESKNATSGAVGTRTDEEQGQRAAITDGKSSSRASPPASHTSSVPISRQSNTSTKAGKQHAVASNPAKLERDQSSICSSKRRRSVRDRLDDLTNTPWTREQAECGLPQSAVRFGHTALRPVRDEKEEAGTARQDVFSSCKTPEGLRRVSAYFLSVLHERCGQGVSCPPIGRKALRVTLTDKKRDLWFDRLADSASPLLESARSVPHGIHGRALLQKCLEKKVPIARVVWLVKTIGANELRAFRRKGVTDTAVHQYELDCIRHWTAEVHSFMDGHAQRHRQPGWKRESIYIINIAERLFDEGLLHMADHRDWLLTHLEQAQHKSLPLFLILAQHCQKSLVEDAACASRLASTCLGQLRTLLNAQTQHDPPALRDALQETVKTFAVEQTDRMLLPHSWRETRATVAYLINTGKSDPAAAKLQAVTTMNDRLARWTTGTIFDGDYSILVVTRALDAGTLTLPFENLARAARNASSDPTALVSCVVKWATSPYHAGAQHIYLACRLIRHWHQQHHLNARSTMSAVLVDLRKSSSVSAQAVSHLWAEMFRSGHLDGVQYLQQIAADGSLKSQNKVDVQITTAMPTQSLPANVSNWRRNALMAIGYDFHTSTPPSDLKQAIATQTKAVKNGSSVGRLTPELEGHLGRLKLEDTFVLSKWLHDSLLPFLGRKGEGNDAPFSSRFTRFVVILLEAIKDYAQLHELLVALSQRSDPDGLMCIGSSVEAQDEVFAALGYLSKTWQTLLNTYRTLRIGSYGPHKDFCLFLLRTTYWNKDVREHEQYLKDEISMCETGVAACTPLSDMEVDTVEEGKSDLDQILSNGPQLEAAQLATALDKILAHIVVAKGSSDAQMESVRSNLIALKNANEETFVPLLTQCLRQQLSSADDQETDRVLSTLLTSNCLDPARLLDCVKSSEAKSPISQNQHGEPVAALRCLRFLFITSKRTATDSAADIDPSLDICDRWHKRLSAQHLERDHFISLTRLILSCISADSGSDLHTDFESLLAAPAFRAVMRRLISNHTEDLLVELNAHLRSASDDSIMQLRRTIFSLFHLPSDTIAAAVTGFQAGDHTSKSIQARIAISKALLTDVDTCSLPLSRVLLRLITTSDSQTCPEDLAEAFWQVATRAAVGGSSLTTELISKVEPRIGRMLRARAENALLHSTKPSKYINSTFSHEWPVRPMVLASIVSAFHTSSPLSDEPGPSQIILQHLDYISEAVGSPAPDNPVFFDGIQAILCISLVYEKAFGIEVDVVRLMHSLCSVVSAVTLQEHAEIVDLARDAACFFAARLNQQAAQRLRLNLGYLAEDTRLQKILGEPRADHPEEPARAFFTTSSASISTKKWEELLNPQSIDTKVNFDLLDISITP